MSWTEEQMALEVLALIPNQSTLNLGIGLPTKIANFIKPEQQLVLHSENGVLGVGPSPKTGQVSPTLINAGKETITVNPGASFFDSAMSFGMIRGGHVDFSILGGMEVDCEGNLANWMIPGKKVTGMGGAMDLVNGSKQVIVMMTHFNKQGESKIVPQCQLPLTGKNVVDTVVTDLGVFRFENTCYKILKLAPGVNSVLFNKQVFKE
jgi:3-oxoacid CoA-transferase subunit B